MIKQFELQLDQGLRNAEQGEMGRALALSKLESIKADINSLEKNLADESAVVKQTVAEMLQKHQPSELDPQMVASLDEKKNEIFA